MRHDHSPLKRRFSEWTNPGIVADAILLLLIGLPMVLWLMTYKSDAAVIMFVVTWLSLTVFVLMMVKRGELDPRHFVDRKVINRTKQEIVAHRIAVRRELLVHEIAALRRGEKAPVLDVWRLDETLKKRHPYFAAATAIVIDPGQREFHARIQLAEMPESDNERKLFCETMLKDIVSYFKIVSHDAYLHLLRTFFDTVCVQVDSIREDDRHVDVSYPMLSLCVTASTFDSLYSFPDLDVKSLFKIADVRFADGKEIEPHRTIDLPSAHGLK